MLLEVGMGIEIVESVDLGLAEIGVERRTVSGDGEGDVPLTGFDDFLGVVAAIVFFVEEEPLGMVCGLGGDVIGDRAADESCGVGGRRGLGLRGARQREQNQERGRADERKRTGGVRVAVGGSGHRVYGSSRDEARLAKVA
jgi:hypothetical protein